MAASVTTAAPSPQAEAGRVGTLSMSARRAIGAVSRWWTAFAVSGQLGTDRERELGRHTGARI
jgi:hypothetical protein